MTGWVAGRARGLVSRFGDGGVQGRVKGWMGICMDDRLYLLWMSRPYQSSTAGREGLNLLQIELTVCLKQTLTTQEAQLGLI